MVAPSHAGSPGSIPGASTGRLLYSLPLKKNPPCDSGLHCSQVDVEHAYGAEVSCCQEHMVFIFILIHSVHFNIFSQTFMILIYVVLHAPIVR